MILVVGATGLVGGMIARTLLNQRRPVRVLVREGRDYQALVDAGAEAALGDLKNPETLTVACRGVDVVITTASAGQRGGPDTPDTVDLAGNQHLVDAARAAGVKQFIYVSALTATLDHPVPLPRAKARAEVIVRDSGMPYTILAANGIMDVMIPQVVTDRIRAAQPVTLVGEARRRHSFVAARDIAAFAVAAVNHPAAVNRRIAIGGPEAVSWRDIVAAHERTLGRPVPVRCIAPGELLPDLPAIPGLTELVSGLLAALETFDTPLDMAETSRTFGVRLTSLDDFVKAAMQPNDSYPAAGVAARA